MALFTRGSLMNPANPIGESRTEEQAADIRLETDCLHLVSRLEQLLATLVDPELGGPVKSSLCRSKEMLVEVLEFTTNHFDSPAVELFSERVRQVCARSKHLEANLKEGFWNALTQNLTLKRRHARQEEDNARRLEFSALGNELNDLFDDFFNTWKEHYSDPDRAAEWEDAYRVFLEDFRVRWSRV
jgi:hypothetical protein